MKPSSLCAIAFTFAILVYTVFGFFEKGSSSQRNTGFLNIESDSEGEDTLREVKSGLATEEKTQQEEDNFEPYFKGLQTLLKGETRKKELNFLVLGDFGYLSGKEHPGTLELAEFIYNRVKNTYLQYDFIVSVGDILYNFGVESDKDPNPRILFEDVFKMNQLGLDWYSVLGNHDCMGNLPATYALADKFPLWKQSESYYHRIFNIGSSNLKAGFVFLNGCELVCLTHDSPECYRGTLKNINFDILEDQVGWFENILSEMAQDKTIVWKVVVIHNGIFSAGVSHGDNPDLIRAILPLLVKYKVDVVLSGHDHNVQYLRMGLDLDETEEDQNQDSVEDEDLNIKCPKGVKKDECIFGEYFHAQLTECGIEKKVNQGNQLQSLYQNNNKHLLDLQGVKFSRDSYSNQNEYLHQFILGNGGTKMQKYCPYKQKSSAGNLRYGNTVLGLSDIRIQEDKLEVNLISTKNEVLYSVKIMRKNDNHGEL